MKIFFKNNKENNMKKAIMIVAGLISIGMSQNVIAGGDHQHGHDDHVMESMDGHHQMKGMGHNPCAMKAMKAMQGMKKGTFLKKEVVDGYDVSFHVMKAPEGMEHGGTHHIMVKVENNNEIAGLKAVNSKVTHPNGESESKMMMKMGDWYMAGYELGHAGDHKIMVLFKTEDGQKHFGGIVYPSK